MNPYDKVPYPGYTHAQTHPERLAVLGQLFGLKPATVGQCRVLELGCGNGSNLVPMAWSLPGSEFVGIDLASRPVAQGQQMIADLGLRNARLVHGSITDIDASWGCFDYIVAHGLYSWIPAEVRDRLMVVCRQCLTPQGIAFVSYNAYPGCHLREMLREMMLFHVRGFDAAERVQQAKSLARFLAEGTDSGDEYGLWMKAELDRVLDHDEGHLYHDELSEINQPFFFTQFISQAVRHGLQYLAEADFFEMSAHLFTPSTRAVLGEIAHDRIRREQYMDFVKCRRFRQTLLCHREVELAAEPLPEAIGGFHISSPAECRTHPVDLHPGKNVLFQSPKGAKAETDFAPGKAALQLLGELWPDSLPFGKLAAQIDLRLRDVGVEEHGGLDNESLCRFLLQLYGAGIVEFRTSAPPHISLPGDCPVASPVARWQIQHGTTVASAFHNAVQIEDEIGRQLLSLLDGKNNRASLTEKLLQFIRSKGVPANPHESESQQRKIINGELERNLAKLGRLGLLTG